MALKREAVKYLIDILYIYSKYITYLRLYWKQKTVPVCSLQTGDNFNLILAVLIFLRFFFFLFRQSSFYLTVFDLSFLVYKRPSSNFSHLLTSFSRHSQIFLSHSPTFLTTFSNLSLSFSHLSPYILKSFSHLLLPFSRHSQIFLFHSPTFLNTFSNRLSHLFLPFFRNSQIVQPPSPTFLSTFLNLSTSFSHLSPSILKSFSHLLLPFSRHSQILLPPFSYSPDILKSFYLILLPSPYNLKSFIPPYPTTFSNLSPTSYNLSPDILKSFSQFLPPSPIFLQTFSNPSTNFSPLPPSFSRHSQILLLFSPNCFLTLKTTSPGSGSSSSFDFYAQILEKQIS